MHREFSFTGFECLVGQGFFFLEGETEESKEAAEASDALLMDALDNMSEGIVIYDKNNKLVLANRGDGPDKVLDEVAARAPDGFERIADVMERAELEEIARNYKSLAGFDVEELNQRASLITL